MDTVNGNRDLTNTYGCITTIYDFYTGHKIDVVLTKYKKEIIRLWICPYIYSLDLEWKIMQPSGHILVKNLENLKENFIYTKFNKLKEFKIIQHSNEYIGWPDSSTNIWYDNDLVISK